MRVGVVRKLRQADRRPKRHGRQGDQLVQQGASGKDLPRDPCYPIVQLQGRPLVPFFVVVLCLIFTDSKPGMAAPFLRQTMLLPHFDCDSRQVGHRIRRQVLSSRVTAPCGCVGLRSSSLHSKKSAAKDLHGDSNRSTFSNMRQHSRFRSQV